jgi:hypothetical protein
MSVPGYPDQHCKPSLSRVQEGGQLFNKSTRNLEKHEQVPSVSAKDHLPFFDDNDFVVQLMDYQHLAKMRSTYVGHPARGDEEATGFWQYINTTTSTRHSCFTALSLEGRHLPRQTLRICQSAGAAA